MSMNDFDDDRIAEDNAPLVGSLQVGTKSFAVGLQWHQANVDPKAEGKAALKESDGAFNLYCARSNKLSQQYALGSTEFGHASNMPSLAAHIASKADAWLGVFEVDAGVYFLAVKDGAILAESDRVMDPEEARDYFQQYLNTGTVWGRVIAPTEWGYDDAEDVMLSDAVAEVGKPKITLQTASGINFKLVGAVLAGALVVVVGAHEFSVYREHAREVRLEAIRAELAKKMHTEKKPAFVAVPFEGQPSAVNFLSSCVATLTEHDAEVAGWTRGAEGCANGRASFDLQRTGGTINWIAESLNTATFRPEIVPKGEKSAVILWSMPKLSAYQKGAPGGRLAATQRYLMSQLDERFINSRFSKPSQGNGYSKVGFTITTTSDPRQLAGILYPVPAIVITNVTHSLNGQWQIKGDFYERRQIVPRKR